MNPKEPSRWSTFLLDAVIVIAVLAAFGGLGWVLLQRTASPPQRAELPLPSDPIHLERTWSKGNPAAKVVILELSDFQCPACKSFVKNAMSPLVAKYVDTGRVRLAFRHYPLESIHPQAVGAAVAANCAGAQGKFWQMHDALFGSDDLARVDFTNLAASVGVERKSFETCVQQTDPSVVRLDPKQAADMGVGGTPVFLIGIVTNDGRLQVKQRVSGAASLERFEEVLKKVL